MRWLGRVVVLIAGVCLIQFATIFSVWISMGLIFVGVCLIEWWAVDKFRDRNDL